jgi:hypothetical protein
MKRVLINLDMHPDDYSRVRSGAKATKIPEKEFVGLALHRGVEVLVRESDVWASEEDNSAAELAAAEQSSTSVCEQAASAASCVKS